MQLSKDQRLWIYDQMITSRYLEEDLIQIYLEGKQPVFDWAAGPLPGEMHLSYGQEAVGPGLAICLDNTKDWVHAGHRPHHVAIAHGVHFNEMVAELLGKKTGLCKGKGGHMHLYDARVKFAASSIIGEQMPAAVGMAMQCKMEKTGGIAVSVTGDGGANQGSFHEALNFAAIQKLPYVAVIEDNNWAISMSKAESTAVARNSDRGSAYGIPGEYVKGNDPEKIMVACQKAVDRARNGGGPSIVEIETYRFMGHFFPDPGAYIPQEEKDSWTDCTVEYRKHLLEQGVVKEAELDALEKTVKDKIATAVKFARESDFSPNSEIYTQVFTDA